ncbi:DUF84 family protein [Oceanobacillus luteolus]|uniref:inosine/xanthosine triphosphatase n=1 Tax=Oceanobacillus luteolus TaxID=1274358 RepID=A0ABW4HT01_9BACI|nr:DUF84 family protein [Oceanobacillus luteolus]MCM3739368.1 DUF84 family protein [Oceanobacillus luteolus]
MKLILGSKNPTKIRACKAVFPEHEVIGVSVASNVSPQPSTDEETRQGSINRALASISSKDADMGVGLEGGVMLLEGRLYLCNWGALVTSNGDIYTASGARIELPIDFVPELNSGKELGEIMEAYSKKEDVRSNEGAVGIFTNDIVDRSEMFTHVMQLLRGQMEYWSR